MSELQASKLVRVEHVGGEITGIKYSKRWTRVTITVKGLRGREKDLILKNRWTGENITPYTWVHGKVTFLMSDRYRWELLIEALADS